MTEHKKIICDECGQQIQPKKQPESFEEQMEQRINSGMFVLSYVDECAPYLNGTIHFCSRKHLCDYFEVKGKEKMNDKDKNKIIKQKTKAAHEYLKKFVNDFDKAKRGGVHDFIETMLALMTQTSIDRIDAYLKDGHEHVNGNEIMAITLSAFQFVLDNAKRNLDAMKEVEMHE